MNRIRHDRRGFTLVELLVTMLLVGLLAAIAWLRVEGINEEAYRASVKADLRSVSVAQELYYQTHMVYGQTDQLEAYVPTEGVTVVMTHADARGYAATATHAGLSGETCGYFTGTVPAGAADPAEEPGVTACD
ncbi:MAG: prepilin-type N-terminal cleavage/methylation domain-containing protein [Longimicrobiales bacterium]